MRIDSGRISTCILWTVTTNRKSTTSTRVGLLHVAVVNRMSPVNEIILGK
jgi:hypothetical protein